MMASAVGWMLGGVLGMRHALEPDHLAAVSTLVAQHQRPRWCAGLGALWGVGHSAGLLLLGGLLAAVQGQLSTVHGQGLELVVACMLCFLGVRAIRQAYRGAKVGQRGWHHHGEHQHLHPAAALDHVHLAGWTLLRRPLWVGLMHGLAGSGALVSLTMVHQPTLGAQLIFMLCFGLGSVVGMAAVAGAAGACLGAVARHAKVAAGALLLSGLMSVAVGLSWGVEAAQVLANGAW